MANSFPSSGTVTLDNGASNALQITTTVSDNTTRDAISLQENSGQATGRQAISWYNTGIPYYKARIWTQVGSGYNETTFGIDVADNAKNVDTRLIIQNGNVGIGTLSPTTRLQVNGDASIMSANNSSAGRSSYMRFANTADSTTAYFGLDGGGLIGSENGATLVGSSSGKSILFAPALTEKMRITSTGRVGIGTSNPSANLQVLQEVYVIGGTNPRTVIGDTTGNGSWGATKWDTFKGTFQIIHSSYNTETGSLIVSSSGNIGIKTTTPGTYALNVNGTFYSAGSSQEYKTEISTFDTDTDKLMQLRPVTYQYKSEYKHLGKELKSGTQIGLIAEEVAEVFPELAILKEDEDGETRVRNVDYEKLAILLLSEVQKLRKEVNELKTK